MCLCVYVYAGVATSVTAGICMLVVATNMFWQCLNVENMTVNVMLVNTTVFMFCQFISENSSCVVCCSM